MAGLFQGAPQTATSYVTSSAETPKWMQDAIYNQVQLATNVANRPYQAYSMPTVAELSPLQKQAYSQVQENVGAFQPNMDFAASGLKTNEKALTAANPYLSSAAQIAPSQISQYMSPYQQGVLDVIAKQGARNLSENLLPQVSDSFIKAGQFGSNRMGEFGSRALRDTQEAVLNQQAQAAQQGYAQAMQAAQTDLGRQAQIGATAGSIASSDLSRQIQSMMGLADITRQNQALLTGDVAALEAAGSAQQRQNQMMIDADRQKFEAMQNYPKQQLDWLNTQIRGMAPLTPPVTSQAGTTSGASYSPSPLSQLATGLYTAKGLGAI